MIFGADPCVVLLDAKEARLVLLRDDAAVEGHERFHGLALDVAKHHGEAQPEAAGEPGCSKETYDGESIPVKV